MVTGEGLTCEPGKPVLPAVSRMVIVPPDAGLELIVRSDEARVIQGENLPAIFAEEKPSIFMIFS